jgi:hypothetical protein
VTLSTLRNKDASNARSPDLTMVDLNFCLIDLRTCADNNLTLSAVHVQNVRNSVLLLPKLQGSILLHDIENCVMVVDCQQVQASLHTIIQVLIEFNYTVPHACIHGSRCVSLYPLPPSH